MIKQQRGVALITAMLITALATVVAVSMASRQHLDISRTANVLELDQAYLFALGVEDWARQILARDREDNSKDHTGEDWATILPPIVVEGAVVSGKIEDMQGLFNINNLIDNGKPSKVDVERFRRLLKAVDLDDNLSDAVLDWIDENEDLTFPDGAEDGAYLGETPAYRTPNSLMASPSELRLIKGFTEESMEALAPFITALPERTTINVNTAPAQVLMSLADGMTFSEAEEIISDREDDGYDNIDTFLNIKSVKGHIKQTDDLGLESQYFLISADSYYGKSHIELFSLINRTDDAKTQVVMRSQGAI